MKKKTNLYLESELVEKANEILNEFPKTYLSAFVDQCLYMLTKNPELKFNIKKLGEIK